jgi:SPW repeat
MTTGVSKRTTNDGAAVRAATSDTYAGEYTTPPTGRHAAAQVAGALGTLAGVWVAISPWFLTLGRRETANDLIVGMVVAALGLFGLAGVRGFTGLLTGSALAGIWLIISPFILAAKFAVSAPMYWSNGFGGLAVLIFALAGLATLRRHAGAVR